MHLLSSTHFQIRVLIHGDPESLAQWLKKSHTWKSLLPLLLAITLGCAAYGFAIGLWRAPLQGAFVGVKMPLLIFLTLLVNGLINGMLGLLLGSGFSFKQTLTASLMSFTIFSLIVGSLSPIAIAVVLDAPAPGAPGADAWYRTILLTHTAIIAFAGIVANHKLLQLIQIFSGSIGTGWRTLLAWLAGNLFVGAQLSYHLRPFFGNPSLPVQFLRPNPFDGSFYESVWRLTLASLPDERMELIALGWAFVILMMLFLIFTSLWILRLLRPQP